jgi:hypothetical protein
MGVDELIKQATERGIKNLPEPSHLSHGRVWPSGDAWVAELGEPPNNTAIKAEAGTGLFTTKEKARAAALAQINEARTALRAALPDDLAEKADSLPDPVVEEWE